METFVMPKVQLIILLLLLIDDPVFGQLDIDEFNNRITVYHPKNDSTYTLTYKCSDEDLNVRAFGDSSYYFIDPYDQKVMAFSGIHGGWSILPFSMKVGRPSISENYGTLFFKDEVTKKWWAYAESSARWDSYDYTVDSSLTILKLDGNLIIKDPLKKKVSAFAASTGQWKTITYADVDEGISLQLFKKYFYFIDHKKDEITVFSIQLGQWIPVSYFCNDQQLEVKVEDDWIYFIDQFKSHLNILHAEDTKWRNFEFTQDWSQMEIVIEGNELSVFLDKKGTQGSHQTTRLKTYRARLSK